MRRAFAVPSTRGRRLRAPLAVGAAVLVLGGLASCGPPPPAPTVTGITPTSGPTAGGTAVTIAGTNFTGVTNVKFGASAATALNVVSATSIIATSPAGTGTVDVTVVNDGGTSTHERGRQVHLHRAAATPPTVTGISPTSGPTTGATTVTVTGTNLTGATAVKFGATAAASFTVTNATSITATSPAGTGTVDVTVTTPGGTTTTGAADKFTYIVPPPPTPTVTGHQPDFGTDHRRDDGHRHRHQPHRRDRGEVRRDRGRVVHRHQRHHHHRHVTRGHRHRRRHRHHTRRHHHDRRRRQVHLHRVPRPGRSRHRSPAGGSSTGRPRSSAPRHPPNLQLTPAENWQVGSAFWPTPVPGAGVNAAFDAFIGPGSGADGLTFTLADASVTAPTAVGVTGGGEGFSGLNGVAVSLDTWKNDAADPSSNFVGIATTNSPTQALNYVATNSTIPSLVNTLHHFVVSTSATGLIVTMDGAQVLDYTTSLPPYVLLGFTGSTGGFNDIHQVQNVAITAGSPPPAPTVTAISPISGPDTGGTNVIITGTDFIGVSGVTFGANAATFAVNSATSITATAPAGTGTVDVTVTAGGRTTATSAADRFTNITGPPPPPAAPTVTGVSPASGPDTGGTTVTVTGVNFADATAVNFGPPPRPRSRSNNATKITATAPAGTGTVDVTVVNGGGTSATGTADHYTYVPGPPLPPVVNSVDPLGGPTGSLVTVSGTSLTGATSVKFGAVAATFIVNNATTITATAPAGTGTVDVTVTTPVGNESDQRRRRLHVRRRRRRPTGSRRRWRADGSSTVRPRSAPPRRRPTWR